MKRASHRRRAARPSSVAIVAILPISPAHDALREIVRALTESLAAGKNHNKFDGRGDDRDAIERFLAECTVREIGGRVQASVLAEAFGRWAKAHGVSPLSSKRLATALKQRRFTSKHSGCNWWCDINLKSAANSFAQDAARTNKRVRCKFRPRRQSR
jgi:hypothetical protein